MIERHLYDRMLLVFTDGLSFLCARFASMSFGTTIDMKSRVTVPVVSTWTFCADLRLRRLLMFLSNLLAAYSQTEKVPVECSLRFLVRNEVNPVQLYEALFLSVEASFSVFSSLEEKQHTVDSVRSVPVHTRILAFELLRLS